MKYTYRQNAASQNTTCNEFDYTIIRKKRMKHSYIRIANGMAIVTSSAGTSLKALHGFVAEKSSWIAKQLTLQMETYDLLAPNAIISLKGVHHTIQLMIDSERSDETMIIRRDSALFLLNNQPTHETLQILRNNHYKAQCKETLLPIIESLSHRMKLYPTKIGFRRAKTRWGSCSPKNSISLNTHLMMLPLDLMEYIVIHELAHIQHKNHSKQFWQLVEQYEPNWREKRHCIRDYEKMF